MYYIYENTSVQSILENLYAKKYIKQNGKLLEFHVDNNNLALNIYGDDSPPILLETYTVEKNIKGEFGICEDENQIVHMVVATKKYDLLYIRFDGESLYKETIYHFGNNTIPTTPVLQARNNTIVVISEFLTVGSQKEWALRSYVKRNGAWEFLMIDKGNGLCYVQPDFKMDHQNRIHLLYREFKEKSCLKYNTYQATTSKPEKSKTIFENDNNKYAPSIFLKDTGEVVASWVEITENEAVLCCSGIRTDGREIFKLDITQNISDARIYSSGRHIYCIFQNEDGFYYDMCCRRKLVQQWNHKIMPKRGGTSMSSDFRLFLDIKRELESRINELKNKPGSNENKETINQLEKENCKLEEQLNEKQKEIKDFREQLAKLQLEYGTLSERLKKYEQQKQSEEERAQSVENEKTEKAAQSPTTWNRFLSFFHGD